MTGCSKIGRLLNLVVSFVLFYTACFQTDRKDGFMWMWMLVFLVPALLTLIVSVRPQAIETEEVQAVWSVSLGCLLCLLVNLVVVALRAIAQGPPFLAGYHSFLSSLFFYRESWDVVSVMLLLMWLKFLSMVSREYLRDEGMAKTQVSAMRMLKMTLLSAAVTGCTLALCYLSYHFSPVFSH